MADSGHTEPSGRSEGDVMYVWKIPVDRVYVKSLVSVVKVVIAILSLIAFICCASGRSENCDDSYSSTYNFFEFVSISCFLTIIFLWFFFVLTLDDKLCFKLVPWLLAELVYSGLYAIFFILSSIIIAAQACGKDSNRAAAAFGFFCLFAVCGHGFLIFRQWRESRNNRASTEAPPKTSPQYDAERNMELY